MESALKKTQSPCTFLVFCCKHLDILEKLMEICCTPWQQAAKQASYDPTLAVCTIFAPTDEALARYAQSDPQAALALCTRCGYNAVASHVVRAQAAISKTQARSSCANSLLSMPIVVGPNVALSTAGTQRLPLAALLSVDIPVGTTTFVSEGGNPLAVSKDSHANMTVQLKALLSVDYLKARLCILSCSHANVTVASSTWGQAARLSERASERPPPRGCCLWQQALHDHVGQLASVALNSSLPEHSQRGFLDQASNKKLDLCCVQR
eukprot:1155585-Pelagomonas_calceolata.AAC.2